MSAVVKFLFELCQIASAVLILTFLSLFIAMTAKAFWNALKEEKKDDTK